MRGLNLKPSIDMPEKLDALLVQRADCSFYPPTINQANILVRSGLRVGLLDGCNQSGQLSSLDSKVVLLRPLCGCRGHESLNFVLFFLKVLKVSEPSVCISYDVIASLLLGMSFYKGKKIFHFHEFPGDYEEKVSIRYHLQSKLVARLSRKVDSLILADSHRASAFYYANKLTEFPCTVRNCSATLKQLPNGQLRKTLRAKGVEPKWIVLFQGAMSVNYYVDKIVASMRFWPEGSFFVFIGKVQEDVRTNIDRIAQRYGVIDRIVYVGSVPYKEIFSYSIDADIALTMIKPVTFNFRHMAGASNKRYEAMACGIPQVSNIGPSMKELIEDNSVGVCIDPENPENIGRAVTELLSNPELRKEMGEKARALHLAQYNYEQEFRPVQHKVIEWCQEKNEV